MNIDDVIKFFDKLCADIHGRPWNGPGVLIYGGTLSGNEKCLMKSLVDDIGLISEIV